MKKLILLPVVTLLLSLNLNSLTAQQLIFFDTVKVFKQSEVYDYSNPVFSHRTEGLVNESKSSKVAYLKSDQNSSAIMVSHFDYYNETHEFEIVNDNSDKSSYSIFSDMIVWHSNISGSYSIYYSVFNNGSYTTPAPVLISASDDKNPKVVLNQNAACVVFERDSNIYATFYQNGNWGNEVNITDNLPGKFYSPVLVVSGDYFVVYSEIRDGQFYNKANQVIFNNNSASVMSQFQLTNSPNLLKVHSSGKGGYNGFTYNSFSQGNMKALEQQIPSWGNPYEVGLNHSGDKKDLKVSRFGFLVDNPQGTWETYFAYLNKRDDSLFLVIDDGNIWSLREKQFYSGFQNDLNFDLSNPVYKTGQSNYEYRIRLMWEKEINGKMALLESNCYDDLTNLQTNVSEVPASFSLHQNFPNPFNPTTNIKFSLPSTQYTILKIFDALGREVATLVNETLNAGSYNYHWTIANVQLGSGIYFYRLSAGDFSETKRMLLVK